MKKLVKMKFTGLVIVSLLYVNPYCFSDISDNPDLMEAMQQIQEATVPFNFYGQVLDQNSQPVKDVEVSVLVYFFDLTQNNFFYDNEKTIQLTTDADGKFQLSDQGRQITIKMQKVGYEFINSENPSNIYDFGLTGRLHESDMNSPVVFCLHKKSYPAYLTGGTTLFHDVLEERFDLSDAFQTEFCVTEGYNDAYGKPGIMPDGSYIGFNGSRWEAKDIQVSGSVSGSNYDIIFTPLIPNSGLILSDDLLEEAPESGYKSSVTISVPTGNVASIKKYIYAQTSNSSFYSRFDIKISIRRRGIGRVDITSWTNPAGSRNLSYDQEYQDHEHTWRDRLADLRYAATKLKEEIRDKYLLRYKLGDILGIKSDGTFDETLFQQEADALKAQLKKKDPRWWHKLEKTEKK